MSGSANDAESIPSDVELPETDDATYTDGGAPTDEAHEKAGDGSSTGSVPAGLTISELEEVARNGNSNDGGTG